jgi:hypothetical protein
VPGITIALFSVKPDESALLPTQPVIVTVVFARSVVAGAVVCANAGAAVSSVIPQSMIVFIVPPFVQACLCKGDAKGISEFRIQISE